MWSVSGGVQDEGKRPRAQKQLTVAMFSIIITQLLELQIPCFLVRLVLGIELETNFVEPSFSFRIHSASFEACTLPTDPTIQLRDFLVPFSHIACNSRR
jgi:hypothetical protein